MCGICGVFCKEEEENILNSTSKIIHNILFELQHRGQDAAGIAVSLFGKNGIKYYKGKGYVSEVFKSKKTFFGIRDNGSPLDKLIGNVGIGHVRYGTFGSDKIAHPFVHKNLALVCNSNIVNYNKIKEEFKLKSKCDSEGITQLLQTFFEEEGIIDGIKEFSEIAEGSYSMNIIYKGNLIALRDPLGFMPLYFGKIGNYNVFASESVALDHFNGTLIGDVNPGEIYINDENFTYAKSRRHYHCMFQYIYHAMPESIIDGVCVYEARERLGRKLARDFPPEGDVDYVMCIPDSSRPAAQAYAEELGIPYKEYLIKNKYIGRTFIMPKMEMRNLAVNMKFNIVKEKVRNKKIVLVDDSIVRGTTIREIVKMFKKLNTEVHLRITCPPIISFCPYGIDMSTREELIAYNKEIDEIREFIGADSLEYQKLSSLEEAIGLNDLCVSCLTGKYPTKYAQKLTKFSGSIRYYECL